MVDFSIGNKSTGNIYEPEGNISIKRKTHSRSGIEDDIYKSDKGYKEDSVPPPDNPQLESANRDASKEYPMAKQSSPDKSFAENLSDQINDLSDEQFAELTQSNPSLLSKGQARNTLIFAWNHPGANTDPKVKSMLAQFVNQAKQQTIQQLKLSSNWTPPQPNTTASNKDVTSTYNDSFESVAQDLTSNESDKNAIEFAHYHPEYETKLSPELKNFMTAAEIAAETTAQASSGAPDGWDLPKDSSEFDAKIKAHHNASFDGHLSKLAQQKGLSTQDKAALRTLQRDPDANVQHREKLFAIYKQLNEQSWQEMQDQFSLPANFKQPSSSKQYNDMIQKQFASSFKENLNNQDPPLSSSQKTALLNAQNNNGQNLPPDLKALFNKIKNETIHEITERFGLSTDWQPKSKLAVDPRKDKKTLQKSEAGTGETDESETLDEAKAGVSLDGTGPIRQRAAISEKVALSDIPTPAPRDLDIKKNIISHAQDITNELTNWGQNYLGPNEKLHMGDCMYIVAMALSNLRETLYSSQMADSNFLTKSAQMQKEVTQAQIDKQRDYMNKMKEHHAKHCVIFNFVSTAIPVPVIAKTINNSILLSVWSLDILSGGVIATACQACNMQPIEENPLVMMGMMNKKDAQWFDLALQVTVMLAEIAISCLLAQPELVMGAVTLMTADIADAAVQAAIRAAAEAVLEAAAEATAENVAKQVVAKTAEKIGEETAREVTDQVAKQAVKEVFDEAVEETAEQTLEKIAKNALNEGDKFDISQAGKTTVREGGENVQKMTRKELQKLMEQRMQEAIEETLQQSQQQGAKVGVRDAAHEGIRKASDNFVKRMAERESLKAVEDYPDKFVDEGTEVGIKESLTQAKQEISRTVDNALYKLKRTLRLAEEQDDEVVREFVKASQKAAVKERMGLANKILPAFDKITLIQNVITSGIQATTYGIQAKMLMQQAQLEMELARLEADIANLGADLQVLKKAMTQMLTVVSQIGAWIGDINKQQTQYWQKNQIHFISA